MSETQNASLRRVSGVMRFKGKEVAWHGNDTQPQRARHRKNVIVHTIQVYERTARALILIGPPKTASTHVQTILASNQELLLGAGWQWPQGLWGQRAGPKSFANLATALAAQPRHSSYVERPAFYLSMLSHCRGPPFNSSRKVIHFFRREFQRVRRSRDAPNLILSAEDLAFFDGRDPVQIHARGQLRRLLSPFERVHVALTYRTPRVEHLHSMFAEEV